MGVIICELCKTVSLENIEEYNLKNLIPLSPSKIQQIFISLTLFRQIVLSNLKDYTFKQNKSTKTRSTESFRDSKT